MGEKPALVMFVGGPGSGKSTFARHLADRLKAIQLNSDSIRFSMWGSVEAIRAAHANENERAHNNKLTFGALDYAATQALRAGYGVVYDCNANSFNERKKLVKIAEAEEGVGIVVWLMTPMNVAATRLEARTPELGQSDHTADTAAKLVEQYVNQIEEPHDNERVVKIDGQQPFEQQYESYKIQLQNILNA